MHAAYRDSPYMKHIATLVLMMFPIFCSGRIIDAHQSITGSPVDTGSEILHFIAPDGSKIGYQANRPGLQITEYVPEHESVERWTNMLTVLIMARSSAPDIDAFFARMSYTFQIACAVGAVVEPPVRFFDGAYPAGMQTATCGKSVQFGSGNATIYKMIQGEHGFYQVQRAWNFPPTDRSEDIKLTQKMRDSARARLDDVHLCHRQKPGQIC